MTILNPDHLFDQAERLSATPVAGSPRQVDLRRAVSSAYYGVFHFILTALADEFVGYSHRRSARYVLVYRSVDHRSFKELCAEVQKPSPTQKYAAYVPTNNFDPIIKNFAVEARELQEQRHRADYDPGSRFATADVRLMVAIARSAVRPFYRADPEHRKVFLTLLLCPPR